MLFAQAKEASPPVTTGPHRLQCLDLDLVSFLWVVFLAQLNFWTARLQSRSCSTLLLGQQEVSKQASTMKPAPAAEEEQSEFLIFA